VQPTTSLCRPDPTTRCSPCSLIFGFGETLYLSADELRRVHREDRVGLRPRVLGQRLRRGRRFCGHSEDEELRGFSFSSSLAGQMISWDVTESKPQQYAEASRYEAGQDALHDGLVSSGRQVSQVPIAIPSLCKVGTQVGDRSDRPPAIYG
jgi:hypothetical protein